MPPSHDSIRVVIADPHRLFAEALADRLAREPDFTVLGAATTAADLSQLSDRGRPHVVLSDLHFPDASLFEIAKGLTRPHGEARLLLLTAVFSDAVAAHGASLDAGYLLKTEPAAAVTEAVRTAAAGGRPVSSEVVARMRFDGAPGSADPVPTPRLAGLTPRQIEVLRLVARGRSGRQIAKELGLTEKGVDTHKYRIMNRLRVRDRVGLTRLAIREGLVSP